MLKILLAVDGSESALRATRELVKHAGWYRETPEIELVTVRAPFPVGGLSGKVVNRDMLERYYHEEGEKALAGSKEMLSAASIKFAPHVLVGDVAKTIVEHAEK